MTEGHVGCGAETIDRVQMNYQVADGPDDSQAAGGGTCGDRESAGQA
jgi:hypothetical protein